MNKWKWLMRILFIILLLSMFFCYKAYVAQSFAPATMPVGHRVPTVKWRLMVHYCCSGQVCAGHHTRLLVEEDFNATRLEYGASN